MQQISRFFKRRSCGEYDLVEPSPYKSGYVGGEESILWEKSVSLLKVFSLTEEPTEEKKAADSAVQIRNLTLSTTGGILDPDDSVADVLDDREQIIAIYDEQDSPPPLHPYRDAASSIGTGSPDPFIQGAYGGRNSAAGSSIGSKFRDSGRSSSPSHGRRQEAEQNFHSVEITDLKSLPASNLVVGGHRDSLRDSGRHSAQPNDLEAEVGVSGDSNEAESDRHFLRKKDQQGRTNEVILPNGSLPHGFSQFNRSSARKSRFTDKWLEAADRIEEDYQLKRFGDSENEDGRNSPVADENHVGNSVNIVEALYLSIGYDKTRPLGLIVEPHHADIDGFSGLIIKGIQPDSRAIKNGRIQIDDRIVQINGVDLSDLNENRALMCLRNAENGVVTLQLIRHKSTSNATPTTPITDGFLPSPVYPADSQPSVSHRPSRTFSHVPSSGDYEEIDRQGPAGMTKKSSSRDNLEIATESSGSSPTTSGTNHATLAETLQRGNTRRIGRKLTINLVKGGDGLGFSVTSRDNIAGGECPIYVKNILPRGAAVIDGRLKAGDRLLEINGSEVTGLAQQDVVQMLRAVHPGETVELLISRQESTSPVLPRHMPAEPKIEELALPNSLKKLLTFEIPLNFSGTAGLGLSVKGRTTTDKDGRVNDEGIFVKNILKGGAVDQDGRLLKNDQLVSVDGVELMGYSNEKAMSILRQIVPQVGTNAKLVKICVLRLVDSKGNPVLVNGSPSIAQANAQKLVGDSGENSFMRRLIDSYTADVAKFGSNTSIPSDSSTLKDGKTSTDTAKTEVPTAKSRPGNILSRDFNGADAVFPQTYRVNGNAEYAIVMKSPTINGPTLSSEIEILDDDEMTESGYNHIIPVSGTVVKTQEEIIPPQRNRYGNHSLKREYSGNRLGNYEVIPDDIRPETSSRSTLCTEDGGKEIDDNFVRDAPGRQSMSEKRRGAAKKDPGSSEFYQKILHKRQGSAPALKDDHGTEDDAEVSINGIKLQPGKSVSMESLSPAVPSFKKDQRLLIHEEIVGMKTPPSKSPNIHLKNKVNRTRLTNESFRAAVDKSVAPNEPEVPMKENGIDIGEAHIQSQVIAGSPVSQRPNVPAFPDFLVSRTTAYRDIHGSPVKEKPDKIGFFNKLFKHGKQTSAKSLPESRSTELESGKSVPDQKKSHMEEQQRIKEEYDKLKRQQQNLPPNFYHHTGTADISFERHSRPSKQPSGWRPQSQISSDEYHLGYPSRSQSGSTGAAAFDSRPVWQLQQNTLGKKEYEESGNGRWVYDNKMYRSLERPSPHSTIDGGHRFQHRLAQNSVPRLTEEVESSQQLSPNWAGLVRAAPAHTDNRRTPVDLTSRVIENERLQQGGKDHQRNVSPQWNNSSEPKFHSNGNSNIIGPMSQTAPDQLRSTQSRMGPPPPWAPPPQSNPAGGRPAFTPNYSSHQRPETKPPGTFNVPVINGSQHANAPSGHQQMKSASQLITPSSENYQQYLRENRRSGGNLNQHANKPRPASNFVEYSLPRNSGRHQQQQLLNGQTQSYSRRDVNSVIYEVPPVDYNNQLRPTAPPRRHLPNGETQGVTLPLPDSRKSAYHNGNERIVERLTIEYPPYAQRMEPSRNCHTAAPPVAPKPKLAAAVAVRHQEIESSKM